MGLLSFAHLIPSGGTGLAGTSFAKPFDVDALPLEIKNSAFQLGIEPEALAKAISYETAGTFDKAKKGPTTKWGQHEGLIQWGQPQQKQYGIDVNGPSDEQMAGVTEYLKNAGVKPGMGEMDIYSAINAGRVGRYNASDRPGKTVATHVAAMQSHAPGAAALLGGGSQDALVGAGSKPKTLSFDHLIPAKAQEAPGAPPSGVEGFGDNLLQNISDRLEGGYKAVTEDPIGTAKGVATGLSEFILPGIQPSEIEAGKNIGNDLGFDPTPGAGIHFDPEKLAKNAYERPLDVALSASSLIPAGVSPVNAAARIGSKATVGTAGKLLKHAVGETSGLGPNAVGEAYRTGKVGGAEGEAFRAGARGKVEASEPVEMAREATDALKADRQAEYLKGKESWKDAPGAKPLKWEPIEAAFDGVMGVKRYRGKDLSPKVAAVRDEVRGVLDEWKADPEAWTPEGFDALKQRLNDVQQGLDPMTQGASRKLVGALTHAVKRQITKQAPEYQKTMKAYEEASNAIEEIQRTLTGTSKTSVDTALRKLLSVFRNNAFTNYTARAQLAEKLAEKAPELMPMLAGMASNSWTPRGLSPRILYGAAGAGIGGGLGVGSLASPWLAPALAAASPRVVGETAHALGRAKRGIDKTGHISPLAAQLLSLMDRDQ